MRIMTKSSPLRIFWFVVLLLCLTAISGVAAFAAQPDITAQPPEPIDVDMNDLSFPPLVGGSPAGPKPPSGVRPVAADPGTMFQSAVDAPVITLWYTANQVFGQNGDPQKWVNIVGNVSSLTTLSSLSYTLNGGPSRNLSVGPNGSRLNKKGDFNIDIDYTDLKTGNNTVVISATDIGGGLSTANVTVNYQPYAGSWSPQTYTINFGTAAQVNDVAQVVDGRWVIDGGKARPAAGETGYDRLIAVGDISWRDYTVSVPVTIHSIDQSKSPGVGLIVRWPGHFDSDNGLQPYAGWRRLGGLAWYKYEKATSTEGLQLLGNGGLISGSKPFTMTPGTTYIFKVKIVSNGPNQPATYSYKVWNSTQPEPATWDIEAAGRAGEPRNGSIILVAHHADVSFGNVTVNLVSTEPKPELTINKTGTGDGTVTAAPQKATYRFGEDVTLTAVPNATSSFVNWQGDATGTNATTTIEMFADRSVTAVFADPSVQTPISDDFSGCTLNSGLWTFMNPLGDATLTMNGSQAEISVPAGTAHDFWSNGLNSPRIMQFAENNDFELEVKFDSPMSAKNQMQGILIAGNDGKYIRFNYLHDGASYKVQAYTFVGAVPQSPARANQAVPITNAPMSLRIKRLLGNYWTLTYFPNPSGSWGTVTAFEFDMTVNSYGVLMGNSGNNPAFTSKVDYFFNTASPITPEDSSRKLNISTTGSGSVTANPQKENYACDEQVTLAATPAQGFKFSSWSGALTGNTNPATITMNTTKTLVANFVPDVQYTVTVSAVGAGTVTKSPDQPTYAPGTQVVITAVPALGNVFSNWSGSETGSINPLTVTVNSNLDIVGNFATAPARTLTLTPIGDGAIDANPDGPTYPHGQTVQLTPLPGANSVFTGWGGDASGDVVPLSIVMNGDKTVTATFLENIYTLQVLSSPAEGGTVQTNPAKPAYYQGEKVMLTPVPATGYKFAGWSGDLTGSDSPGELVMTKNSTVTATFVPGGTYTLQVDTNGDGSVLINPFKEEYGYGDEVTLTAVANPGSEFTSWSGDLTGEENPATIVITKDMQITANFGGEGIYSLTVLPTTNGSVQVEPPRDLYAQDQQVTLLAVPDFGYMFTGWGEDLSGTVNPMVITMTGDLTVSAAFDVAPLYTLTVAPNGPGSVTTNPTGTEFIAGSTVQLTAVPSAGNVFTGWSGDIISNVNPYSLVMDGDKNVVANFSVVSPLVSDDFDGCGTTISPMWTWVDPLGGATRRLTGSQLEIVVPPNLNYDIWKDGNFSARLVQDIANTDFELIVKLESLLTLPSQTQGVLIETNDSEFVRFDILRDATDLRFFGATVSGGISKKRFSEIVDLTGVPAPEISIRVVRKGDQFRAFYRLTDDGSWLSVKGSNFKHGIVVERVGVFAASPATGQTAPGLTALFDYFFNAAAPIVPEDANAPGVTVTQVGQGNVTMTPAGSYTCGQQVQLSATPASGWEFQNYSGDLNGSNPTQVITLSKMHKVTATFLPIEGYTLFLPTTLR